MRNLLLLFVAFTMYFGLSGQSDHNYDKTWNDIYRLELQGLTRSADSLVSTIYLKAKEEMNQPQIIKSLLYQSKFLLITQEDAELKLVNKLKEEIEETDSQMKNILQSVLAEIYNQYYKRHRYQYYSRTRTNKKVDSTDFRTWDHATIISEIGHYYQQSIQNADVLQSTDLAIYDSILEVYGNSKKIRPTVYDWLAHRALQFYRSKDPYTTDPKDNFVINNPHFLYDNASFVAQELTSLDSTSFELNALRIYRELTLFHMNDVDPDALVMLSLERLDYVRSKAVMKEKDELYSRTLQHLSDRYDKAEVVAEVEYKRAHFLFELSREYKTNKNEAYRWKAREALEICKRASELYPSSSGAFRCLSLANVIQSESIEIRTEEFVSRKYDSKVRVDYKNIDQLFFSVYKVELEEWEKLQRISNDSLRKSAIAQLKRLKYWTVTLRNDSDYQNHSTEVLIPKLSTGRYVILASSQPELKEASIYGMSHLQVTDIVLISDQEKGEMIYQVVDRNNGRPLKDATVYISNKESRSAHRRIDKKLTSDHRGMVRFYSLDYYNDVTITVDYKDDLAIFGNTYVQKSYTNSEEQSDVARIFLFSDRSIYRPGQTIYFKGIALMQSPNTSKVIANQLVTVDLDDVNGQTVSSLDLTTNEYGSVSGSFVLPSGGLTGNFTIDAYFDDIDEYEENGYLAIAVEEYKRPRFEVSFEPVVESYQLADTVLIEGKALSFAGSSISDGVVEYTVTRAARYPRWYSYYRPYSTSPGQEITHGKVETDDEGKFKIQFTAVPDLTADPDGQPIFTYEVKADVTDINGETRSATSSVQVGYQSIEIFAKVKSQLSKADERPKIEISTNNLNGSFVPTKGTIKIYKLLAPKRVIRKRPWEAPDFPIMTEKDFINKFPYESWQNEAKIAERNLGELVSQCIVDSETSKEVEIGSIKDWANGRYKLIFEAKDKFGQTVKDEKILTVYDPEATSVADAEVFEIRTDQASYKPGDNAIVTVGTAAKDLTVTLVVLRNDENYQTRIIRLKKSRKSITIPIKEKDRGGMVVYYRYVYHNQFVSGTLPISVPYPKHQLKIETMTFRDKLTPGQDETWSFKLSGPKGEAIAAEVLASMYDRSLDEFKPHQWRLAPINYSFLNGYNQAHASYSLRQGNFNFYNYQGRPQISSQRGFYDRLNWFGLDLNNRGASYQYLRKLRQEFFVEKGSPGSISGVVLDADGTPVIGASVFVQGRREGTITDIDGSYTIAAKPGDVLIVSYLGYSDARIKIEKEISDYQILIEEDANMMLSDVVVTGYAGSPKVARLRGATSVVMEEAEMLSGAVAGVTIEDQDGNSAPMTSEPNDASDNEAETNRLTNTLISVVVRKNLQEGAFFYPHLLTDSTGLIKFSFTTPESLTSWKLQLLGHTKDAMVSSSSQTVVTQKELMVIPNPPRFLREGDRITLQTKIASLVKTPLNGICELQLFDALTDQRIDHLLKNDTTKRTFKIEALGNEEVNWTISLPSDIQAVKYRIVASAGDFSDGEESILPVLSNRMLVTETLPMWLRSNQTKSFTLNKIKEHESSTLKHHKLTLEITSNPAWYAIQALPYLMEYPYECAEQTFARLYANALGHHIVKSQPRIKEVFDQWASSTDLISNLEKNPELKSLMIEETPWLRDAQSETEQKKRISLLFDLNLISDHTRSTISMLKKMQHSSGGFSWWEGGRYPSLFITQHILSGLGHLDHLGVHLESRTLEQIKKRALTYVDMEVNKKYQEILKQAAILKEQAITDSLGVQHEQDYLKSYVPDHQIIQYLYLRSFYQNPIGSDAQKAVQYFTERSYATWLNQNLYCKGMIALVAHRNNRPAVANAVLAMLRENAVYNEELGMYWKSNQPSYYWYRAPIETHALMIEAFSEITNDNKTVDELRVWLLKNKQTNSWKTTKQTTAAVYALLLNGHEWLATSDFVNVAIGSRQIDPLSSEDSRVEAGTGYFKTSWQGSEIEPEMATVTLSKGTDGIAWGGLYWQYFEDLDKITPAETPLHLSKKLFIKTNTDQGELLTEIQEGSETTIGDLIRVRIELKVDREMEYIHMKDMRAAGLEPIDVLSSHRYQDGLSYYQSTKDAATNFFFDRIVPGGYVFEYDLRVNNKGDFSNGVTTIQSMYAPEFSSHSKGVRLIVK